MPELPEVEVTLRGIAPHLEHSTVTGVVTRHSGLRWPFPAQLHKLLSGCEILSLKRRGKYLLLGFAHGTLIVHLGMSGHLRVLPDTTPAQKHDHFDLITGAMLLRLSDPRRFGAVLWHPLEDGDVDQHPALLKLGVEPLGPDFNADYLYQATRKRTASIKQVLLAGNIVVGVGNIYASESLFRAGIHPATPACQIGRVRYEKLVGAIRDTLAAAIEQGGSTLRDFLNADGKAGYFQQSYFVYDREGQPCRICATPIRVIRQGQRSTWYCPRCQRASNRKHAKKVTPFPA